MTAQELLHLDRRGLRALLAGGHAIDPDAIAGWTYRGVSLGLPAWVDRLAWKTFVKEFYRDPQSGTLRGWNVRLRQTGIDGPIEPLLRRGAPVAFGHFRVVADAGERLGAARAGLLLDYGLGGNPRLDPTALLRDPIVALSPGDADLLLGWSYLDLGVGRVGTPSYFALVRHAPLRAPVAPPRR